MMEHSSTKYDDQLTKIEHYQKYPELLPWIGSNFDYFEKKLLLVGESHYLDTDSTYHHDSVAWYQGINISDKSDRKWMITRNIINNGIINNWKERSKAIYRNTEKALFESTLFTDKSSTAYASVAFMNFFQRPAQKTGKSIVVSEQDKIQSNYIFQQVVKEISPDIIIFTSSLAFNFAQKGGSVKVLKELNIPCTRTPHPGMPWWNRVSKKYGNKTGKEHFIGYLDSQKN